ncbi:hypothetical protein BS78_08G076900 [Paspalum vaginatum]|nr:hypothetical protein BS78_08G076900 [Paspalum vaginatum]
MPQRGARGAPVAGRRPRGSPTARSTEKWSSAAGTPSPEARAELACARLCRAASHRCLRRGGRTHAWVASHQRQLRCLPPSHGGGPQQQRRRREVASLGSSRACTKSRLRVLARWTMSSGGDAQLRRRRAQVRGLTPRLL